MENIAQNDTSSAKFLLTTLDSCCCRNDMPRNLKVAATIEETTMPRNLKVAATIEETTISGDIALQKT